MMKKGFLFITTLALFLAAFSCGKENAIGEGIENGASDPTGVPDGPSADEPVAPGTFRAVIDAAELSDEAAAGPSAAPAVTKAYPVWNQSESSIFRVYWRAADQIKVFYDRQGASSGIYTVSTGGGSETATLTLSSEDEASETGTYYAIYPASGAVGIDGTTFTVTIPAEQTDTNTGTSNIDESAQVMIGKCGPEKILNFKQACSFVRLGLRYVIPGFYCNKVVISSATSYLAGHLALRYSGLTPVVTGIVDDAAASHRVTLHIDPTAGSKFTDNGSGSPNYAYLYVSPGTYSDLTFTFTLTDGNGNSYEVTKAAPASLTLYRAKYQQINFTLATNLSASGTANCYTVTEPGVYYFDITKRGNGVVTSGATAAGLSATIASDDVASVAQYYSDGPNSLIDGVYQTTGDGATFIDRLGATNGGYFLPSAKNRVFFKTQDELTVGTSLVSVEDASGNTLWSWHIWCNEDLKDVTLSNSTVWHNMNLGAHQVAFNADGFNGYYYQWGRKDPIQQALGINDVLDSPFVSHANYQSYQDGSLQNTILHPLVFYGGYPTTGTYKCDDWDNADPSMVYYDWWNTNITSDDNLSAAFGKTMFDPCPPGYHVPTYAEHVVLKDLTKAAGTDYGVLIDGSLYLPCTSVRSAGIGRSTWNTGSSSRGYYHCTNPRSTGDITDRTVWRLWTTPSSAGNGDSSCQRAFGMAVRCKKD